MITREAYETIDNSVSEFCSECIASADVADCESCVMTRFIDYVIPKCLFYPSGIKGTGRDKSGCPDRYSLASFNKGFIINHIKGDTVFTASPFLFMAFTPLMIPV